MYTGRYPTGVRWRHDGAGEGPPGTAPRQGRARAHPQRVTAAVPRSGHQPHRHGPALRGSPGVEAHGTPMCPYIAASIEIHDPQHPARQYARDYKKAFAARFAETAREAGAANPEQLGEQLALLLDGASARTRVLNTESFPTAAAIAAVLIDNAIPTTAPSDDRGSIRSAPVRVAGERQPGQAS